MKVVAVLGIWALLAVLVVIFNHAADLVSNKHDVDPTLPPDKVE